MAEETAQDGLHTVDAAQYEEALGAEVPVDADRVAVDRRGYAPRVAEENGEDYMLNQVFIFGPEQVDAPVVREEYSFMDDLLDAVYGNEEIVQYAESEEPLMLDVEVTTEDDAFYGRALLEDTDVREAIDHAEQVREKLRTVTEDELMDEERIRELYAEAREVYERFGGIRDIEFSEEMGRVEVDAFRFDWADGTGFAFHDASTITYDGDRPDHDSFPVLNVRQRRYTLPDGVGTVLEKLHAQGRVGIDKDGIMERRDEVAAEALDELGVDVEVGKLAFYQAMEEHEDGMPEEYHILRYLGRDQDFSVETAKDAVKLDYVTVPTREVEDGDAIREEAEHPTAAAFLDHLRAKESTFFGPVAGEDERRPEPDAEPEPVDEEQEDDAIRVELEYSTADGTGNMDVDFEEVLRQYTDDFDDELQQYLKERLFDE